MAILHRRFLDIPEQVRYTGWSFYEERGSGDLIMALSGQPKRMDVSSMTRSEDFTDDCLRYRIRLN